MTDNSVSRLLSSLRSHGPDPEQGNRWVLPSLNPRAMALPKSRHCHLSAGTMKGLMTSARFLSHSTEHCLVGALQIGRAILVEAGQDLHADDICQRIRATARHIDVKNVCLATSDVRNTLEALRGGLPLALWDQKGRHLALQIFEEPGLRLEVCRILEPGVVVPCV